MMFDNVDGRAKSFFFTAELRKNGVSVPGTRLVAASERGPGLIDGGTYHHMRSLYLELVQDSIESEEFINHHLRDGAVTVILSIDFT